MTNRIRTVAAAFLFLGCLVTLTSAFNLPNRLKDVSSRLDSLRTLTKMPADPVTTLRWLDHADGKADVHRAVTDHRDTRFLGVLELGGIVPGAETPGADTLIHSHGVRWLENTSCIITSPEHLRLAKKAMAYAADYNKLLLQYLAKQKQA
jgi:hypothetical protein